MKIRWMIAAMVVSAFCLAGCNGVNLNAQYSQLLDQTAALSAETAKRADAGLLTPAQMAQALDGQAQVWQTFRDARDGVASTTPPTTTTITKPSTPTTTPATQP